ncbi:hypothetical protein C2E23DRAFT_566456 [Lenzites betulinus]|nr:hypothetical protein C2E23DRAFT_566456 [Lenzites betulinus]
MGELRVSCRMVCTDQWLVTHVDPSWSISQLKLVLLQKFSRERSEAEKNQRSIPVSPHKTRRRSLSPITFATPPRKPRPITAERTASAASAEGSETEELELPAQSDDEDDAGDGDDDDEIVDVNKALAEAHRYKYNTRPSTSSPSDGLARHVPADSSGAAQEADLCVLITFSTTQILEDRFSLEWYGIHADELLELHPLSPSFVSLPRFALDAYIAPYFAARVWALRAVGTALDSTLKDFGIPRDHQTDDEIPDANPRSPLLREKTKKKITLEWKERWAVIHQGVFSLCKERHDTHAAFSAPLSSMLAIRDSTQFDLPLRSSRRTRSIPTASASDIVCVKFTDPAPPRRQRTMSNESYATHYDPAPQESTSPPTQGAWWRRGSRDVSTTLSSSLASSASALMGSPSGAGLAEMWDALARRGSRTGLDDMEGEADDAIWIVLDMLTNAACSHVLRILHRHAPPACESSFLPALPPSRSAPSPIVFSTFTPSSVSPAVSTYDLPTPGPSSSYSFPPLSPSIASPPIPTPLPRSPRVSPPTRPTTPLRAIPLRIDTSTTVCGVPYPEWRLALVRRARRAGLGSVGRAMELVMFGEEDDEEEEDELAIEWARRLSAMTASPMDYPPRSRSRSRAARHASDSAIPSPAEDMYTPMGEFDAPDPDPHELADEVGSEDEWDSWLDVVMARRRREQLSSRGLPRTDTLDTAVPQDLYWGVGEWDAQGMSTATSSPAASTPEHEHAEPWSQAHSHEQSGSEADDASSMQSAEPSHYARTPLQPVPLSARGRRAKAKGAAGDHGSANGRTLSSYASADSLLKRTIRTAIGGAAKAQVQAKRASVSSAELKLYEAALGNPTPPPPRSSSASPPLSRPSIASLHSISGSRSRPQSPLCPQVQDTNTGGSQRDGRYRDQESRPQHPIPLPGMPMVPSGYTTFRHSSLYGRRSGGRGSSGTTTATTEGAGSERESEEVHAGLTHGQSLQRLPVPMSMMMTTVSSTVSVGHEKPGGTSRWGE